MAQAVSRRQLTAEVRVYKHTEFHGPTLTGATLASTSEVLTSAILVWLKLWDWKYGLDGP
jgi:hypothetical protein